MGHRYAEIAFTDSVCKVQEQSGSRRAYSRFREGEEVNRLLGEREIGFIQARDSFYMATVSETGWPYIQHRGGPAGFVRVLDDNAIGFADFRGNRQYVSVGNLGGNDRVALIFMDYPNRARLKLFGRVELIGTEQQELISRLEVDNYRARVERGFLIHVEAWDWNCPQHITPRYTQAQVDQIMADLLEENRQLRDKLAITGEK